MANKTSTFTNNLPPAVDSTWYNIQQTEMNNLITGSGLTVDNTGAINTQQQQSASRFAANNFYIDSGSADAYVLTLAASFTNPVSATVGYFVGMTIRFRAGNAGTGGAATVNVNQAGDKSLKEADGTTNPISIPTTEDTEWRYDGTVFRKVNGNNATESVAGIAKLAEGFAGFVLPYSKNTPPTGWLECNGAAISRTTYSALFAVTGTVFGVGNGSTTFNIPDFRGEFLRGWDNGKGTDSGRAFGSAQTDAVQNHTHSSAAAAAGTQILDGGVNGAALSGSTTGLMNSGNISTETRPRNFAVMYCIKY